MEKINVAELLKDCPKGMELDCTMWEDVVFARIIEDVAYPILIKKRDGSTETLTEYGCYHLSLDAKCVIFPKGKDTWKGFVPPVEFKDGDIVATMNGGWIGITKGGCNPCNQPTYCVIRSDGNFEAYKGDEKNSFGAFDRLASEEEKETLFQVLKDHGYKWDAEKKCLEKLEKERFDISSLKPFDKVLVRNSNDLDWACDLFSHLRHEDSLLNRFRCIDMSYKYCIPFEGNEHLCGTSEDCDEFYKTWEE